MTREEAISKLQKQKAEYLEEWVDYSGVAEAYDMAIEALKEQEISNELQEYAYECGYEHFFHECQNCEHRIIGNRADGWIPCSEGLPKTMGEYLITVLSNPSKNPITSAAFYSALKKEFGIFKPSGEWEKWNVVAWMPRPKPYRGDGDIERQGKRR